MRSFWRKVRPESNMTGVLIRCWPCEDRDIGRMPCEDGSRDRGYAAASQGMAEQTARSQGEARKDSPLQGVRGSVALPTP